MALINPPSWLQAGTYNARADRLGIGSALSAGGVNSPTSFAVTQTLTPSMSVQISAGAAYVPNTYGIAQGYYAVVNDGTITIALDASHSNFNRSDLIVLRVKDSQYEGSDNFAVVEKITGDPGPGANPAPKPVPANSIVLATVLVTASSSSVTTGNISLLLRQIARLQPSMVNAVQTVTPSTYPEAPTNGQFIIDESLDQLRVRLNGRWFTLAPSTMSTVDVVGERPPGARIGTMIYEQPTKRFYSFDGTKWNYAGGGNGELITNTFTAWQPLYRTIFGTRNAGYQPLTLWRDAEGRYNLEGMFTNAGTIFNWGQWQQYPVCRLPAGYYPPYDLRIDSFVVVPNTGHQTSHIIVKGTHPSSIAPGSPGGILWQPQGSNSWTVPAGQLEMYVPRISWDAP